MRCSPRIRTSSWAPPGSADTARHPERGRRGHLVPGRAHERGTGVRRDHPTAITGTQFPSTRSSSPRRRTARRRWPWCRRTSPAAARSRRGAVPRLRKRPALLVDVHGRVAPAVRDPSAVARSRREEAQGVPDRRRARPRGTARPDAPSEEGDYDDARSRGDPPPRSGEHPVHPVRARWSSRSCSCCGSRSPSRVSGRGPPRRARACLHLGERRLPLLVERQDLQLHRQVDLADRTPSGTAITAGAKFEDRPDARVRPADRPPPARRRPAWRSRRSRCRTRHQLAAARPRGGS